MILIFNLHRNGTDIGFTDGSLGKNVEMVIRQLKRGDVYSVYNEAADKVTSKLKKGDDFMHLQAEKCAIFWCEFLRPIIFPGQKISALAKANGDRLSNTMIL